MAATRNPTPTPPTGPIGTRPVVGPKPPPRARRNPVPTPAPPPTRANTPKPGRDDSRRDAIRAEGEARAKAQERSTFTTQARLLFPWIPEPLLGVFVDAWIEHGDVNLAMAALRADSRYEQYFPGNRRDDGTLRMSEGEYLSTVEGYDRRWMSYGGNPADIAAQKAALIEGDVSPIEFGRRLDNLYLNVVTKGDQIRAFYQQTTGATGLSDTALFMSAALPGVSAPEFEKRIRTAQVGGTAASFGFTRSVQEASRLESFGLDEAAARNLYSQAAQSLPSLSALNDRFGDPNDPLTIDDYENALVVRDADELQTFARLVRQGNVEFSTYGVATDKSGAQRGLLAR